MVSGRLQRRTIALVAAYAVALQALLLAFVPMAASLSGPFAILCSHNGVDGPAQPAKHDLPCAALCAALGNGVSGSLPPGVVVVAVQFRLAPAVASASLWAPPRIARTDPHTPRGPPLA